jgi:pilus assembly protein CpaF
MASLKEKIARLRDKKKGEEKEQPSSEQGGKEAGSKQPSPPIDSSGPSSDSTASASGGPPSAKAYKEPTYEVDRQSISLDEERYNQITRQIIQNLYEILDPGAMGDLPEKEVKRHLREQTGPLLDKMDVSLNRRERRQLIQDVINDMIGYGPLEPLLNDSGISEILVNGPDEIYVEVSGRLRLTDARFRDSDHVMQIIDRIVREVGRHIDEGSPMCDARLPDGSRVNAIIPPLAIDYPALSIRKFRKDVLGMEELVNDFGSFTDEIAVVLQACVKARLNILISGGTGSGKTTLLNILSGCIPRNERIVTIEDSAELQLRQPHTVRLETRPPNIEGEGEITQYDLLKNSLRMRPDRIILGEVRGKEALDMLQAMNTGHEGSMSTIHANSPRDAISRLETMIAMGGVELPQSAMRQQIASAIDVIVQVNRFSDGSRKLTSLSEVMGMEGDTVTMQEIFLFEQQGIAEDGTVGGHHVPTGVQPHFMQRVKTTGIELPGAIFLPHQTIEHHSDALQHIQTELDSEEGVGGNRVTYEANRRKVSIAPERYNKLKAAIQRKLYDELDSAALTELGEDQISGHIKEAATRLTNESGIKLNRQEKAQLIEDLANEMTGYGPLEPLLQDPEVSDILVNGPNQTYVEVGGKLHLTDVKFNDQDHLMHVIHRIVTSVGRHIDPGTPMCDARLQDGSRVNAIIPPLSIDYPSVSIRKFKTDALSINDLVERFGSMSREMAILLQACVHGRLNLLISGGTGAGKTTLLNILSNFIPKDERIVTIEDSAELQLQQPHVVRLETRPANIEGRGEVTQYDLLRNSLRMRPDRIILGEVRGEEALDMLQAMNTGHEGSMSTIHANTPRDALSRMETMIAMGGAEIPQRAMRQQIASAIDVIVQGNRFSDGSRKQTYVSEVLGMEGDTITMQDLFAFESEGINEEGDVLGRFVATGVQPRFLQKVRQSGADLPADIFRRQK